MPADMVMFVKMMQYTYQNCAFQIPKREREIGNVPCYAGHAVTACRHPPPSFKVLLDCSKV
jgi:hypothetical protein